MEVYQSYIYIYVCVCVYICICVCVCVHTDKGGFTIQRARTYARAQPILSLYHYKKFDLE